MILIHTALKWEAEPLIDCFELQRLPSFSHSKVYGHQGLLLLVGGVGKEKTKSSLKCFRDECKMKQGIGAAFNIGLCGAAERFPIGELYYITETLDHATGITYRPGAALQHALPKAKLCTVEQPVTRPDLPAEGLELADMEASAFFETFFAVFPACPCHSLKIPADHFEGTHYRQDFVCGLVSQNLGRIQGLLKQEAGLS
jgi:hypothetical protein